MNRKTQTAKLRVLAAGLLISGLIGCGKGEELEPLPPAKSAFVLTTDYSTGGFSVIALPEKEVALEKKGELSSDVEQAVLRGDKVYVLNRYGADNLQVLNISNWQTTKQVSTVEGSNPYDVEFLNGYAYVTRYGSKSILVLDEKTLEESQEINLGEFSDSDGVPEMAYSATYTSSENKSYLFVALQRWVTDEGSLWHIMDYSSVLAISIKEDGNEEDFKEMQLPLSNPVRDFVFNRKTQEYLLPCAGDNAIVGDGGVIEIDPETMEISVLVDEKTLGGSLYEIAIDEFGENLYAITGTKECGVFGVEGCKMSVILYNFSNSQTSVVYTSDGFDLSDIEVNKDEIWIADRTYTEPGIVILSTLDFSQIKKISTELPPAKILFIR